MKGKQLEEEVREFVFRSIKEETNFHVLEIKLSQLPEDLRTQSVLDKISSILRELATPEGKIIRVPCDDFFVFYPNYIKQDFVFPLLIRVWFLFTKDPDELMKKNLAVIRTLPQDKVAILETMHTAFEKPVHRQKAVMYPEEMIVQQARSKKELTPEGLDKAISILASADFSNMLRRQSVCAVVNNAEPQELFEGVYVSIGDLGEAILPDIDLLGTPWLFQYLTETLDRRVLATTARHEDGSFHRDFSLNLNVSTILSDNFESFNENIRSGMRSSIVFELSLVDIFSDLPSYLKARDIAQGLGYKICINNVTAMTLPFTDRERLGADFLKMNWTPDLFAKIDSIPAYADLITRVGEKRLILSAVDEESVFENAKAYNFTLFQGKFIQTLLSSRSIHR